MDGFTGRAAGAVGGVAFGTGAPYGAGGHCATGAPYGAGGPCGTGAPPLRGIPSPARPVPSVPPAPAVRPRVLDLRGRPGATPRTLSFGPRDLLVVTGLPGGGKSTLMRRAVPGPRVDSQDTRERWAARLPRALPYALYRPLVRLAHYAGLRRALRSGAGVVVHDCGTQPWVRAWLARTARARGGTLHLLLLDVPHGTARAGRRARGRDVSRYASARHRRTTARLLRVLERGEPPAGCGSAVLLDRAAADRLLRIGFGGSGG
ncbi:ATP-binding protein [Streptomyces sp. J2-1]|uniref:AAA family ATPase n=1 Tax=Streptomyces corallincola TaxID=2851888 RepID=UPI001C38F036|nr:AAA family ATPase [Streptomyces corallincola]MBV2353378.1 ATP-binding protein [Streptomyces corallincola]